MITRILLFFRFLLSVSFLFSVRFLVFSFLIFNLACNSLYSLKKNPTDRELLKHALNLQKKSYYTESLSYFYKLKSQFIYSPLIKEADLAIANGYFEQQDWQKASLTYKKFTKLYPQHKKIDFVFFRLAFSYFQQLPSKDRDLKLSTKTLFYFNQHLNRFPKSSYKTKSLKYKQKVLKLLAQKEWMIAVFHLKNKKAHSALPYMLKIISQYSAVLPIKSNKKPANKNSNGNLSIYQNISNDLPSLKGLKKQVLAIKKQLKQK